MMTSAFRDLVLNTTRGSTLPAFTGYCGLIKAITDFRAGTVTEAAYTGYGTRPSITFAAPGNTTPTAGRQISNSAAVTFPQNTGSNEDQIAWGMWSAATGGTLYWIGFLSADAPIFGTGATGDTITAYAHGLNNNQRVFVLAAPGATIPTGLSENTAYHVVNAATDTFQLSASQGGAAVDITAGGAALFMSYQAVTVATNATPEFAASSLVLQL